MKIKIYINNKPIESYSDKELEDIKKRLTYKAFAAAGYEKKKEEVTTHQHERILQDMRISETAR